MMQQMQQFDPFAQPGFPGQFAQSSPMQQSSRGPPMAFQPDEEVQQAGVGLYFKLDKQARFYVEMVLPNTSAAATAVVRPGDVVEGVDNQSVIGISLVQLRAMILGQPGSYVNLSFLREKEAESFRFDVDLLRGDPARYDASDPEVQQMPQAVKLSESGAYASPERAGYPGQQPYSTFQPQFSPESSGEPINISNAPVAGASGGARPGQPQVFSSPIVRDADTNGGHAQVHGQGGAGFGLGTPGTETRAQVEALEKERDGFRKRFLAEQRLHFEADRELGESREIVRQLQEQNETVSLQAEDMQRRLEAERQERAEIAEDMQRRFEGERQERAIAQARAQRSAEGGAEAAEAHVTTLEAQLRLANTKIARLEVGAGQPNSGGGAVDMSEFVPKHVFLEVQSRAQVLEAEVMRQASAVPRSPPPAAASPVEHAVQRLCAMALPAAVSALYKMSEESGHASSATWALIRAEDHIAQMASAHFPLSISFLVQSVHAPESASAAHDAALAMAIISWDPQGRKLLMQEPHAVSSLVRMLAGARTTTIGDDFLQGHALSLVAGGNTGGGQASDAELCARFAAMTLGNFSLEETGRALIAAEQGIMPRLIEAVRGSDPDCGSFALLVVGNLFMITAAREALLEIPGGVDSVVQALYSVETQTVRFAVGAVRNFAADESCRAALLSVEGARPLLEQLTQHAHPRIRDHAAHALANLEGGVPAAAASFAQQAAQQPGFNSNQLLTDFAAYPVAGQA